MLLIGYCIAGNIVGHIGNGDTHKGAYVFHTRINIGGLKFGVFANRQI